MKLYKIYNNEKLNKKILILGGVHGNELTPVHCCKSFYDDVLSRGSNFDITILNACNVKGMIKNVREVPKPGSTDDLNRSFFIFDEDIKQIIDSCIEEADIIIDVHSSPNCTELCIVDINEYSKSYKKFLDSIGVQSVFRYSAGNTIKEYCQKKNKISFTLELNGISFIDFQSSKIGVSILNAFVNNLYSFNLQKDDFQNIQEMRSIKCPKEGFFILDSDVIGKHVHCGDVVGKILDLNFDEVFVKSNVDGTIVCGNDKQYFAFGEPILEIQPDFEEGV